MIRNHMSNSYRAGGACPVDYRGCIEAYILSRGAHAKSFLWSSVWIELFRNDLLSVALKLKIGAIKRAAVLYGWDVLVI